MRFLFEIYRVIVMVIYFDYAIMFYSIGKLRWGTSECPSVVLMCKGLGIHFIQSSVPALGLAEWGHISASMSVRNGSNSD